MYMRPNGSGAALPSADVRLARLGAAGDRHNLDAES